MKRIDGREANQLRPIRIIPHVNKYAEGSVLIEVGDTRVLCTATVEDKVPPFMRGGGKGWITAEYAMLPRATEQRNPRDATKGKISGRTMEIQRLIGRALRSVVRLEELGERTIWLDCDVLQADGGTRTASITGAFVAMVFAMAKLKEQGVISCIPITDFLAATSVGIYEGVPILDLNYAEDSQVKVDLNIVQTGAGKFVEIQGTGEESPFSFDELQQMLNLGRSGIREIIAIQKNVLGNLADEIGGEKGAPPDLPRTIVLATRNLHKVNELHALLAPLGIEVRSAADFPDLPEVVEDGNTFEENAVKKAREVSSRTGLPALADDSGLEVDALNGEPGVYSARYAGPGAGDAVNNQKLLEKMKGIPEEKRGARFVSVIAYALPNGEIHTFRGTCEGRILEEPRGQYGFGYDPLFFLPDQKKSMAELKPEEKNKISHRARAYQQFVEWLKGGKCV